MDARRIRVAYCDFIVAVLETFLITASLLLCGYGYPDTARNMLWEEGGRQGWSSDPRKRIYDYANHRDPPKIPWIWSQRASDLELAAPLAILAFFISWKSLRWSMPEVEHTRTKIWMRLWALVFSIVSGVSQVSGESKGADHNCMRAIPWYLRRGCGDLMGGSEVTVACNVGRGRFAVTILMRWARL
ncbi:hypothetical protein BJ875DRAFT_38144 [Amylocarpus encephaloides]|uniref:Uncharacterized protein n=1 Tax=Amylocarpus encephaloides TaxID=45428 RepID=A0A9P7YHC2_9HELO|nr:hypothetical protein BJ875DRAFT_38144 [Amylocarpus encephaloides]